MPDSPDHKDIWHELNQARLDIAELRGMVKMHFEDGTHHIPPCRPAADMQKNACFGSGGGSHCHARCNIQSDYGGGQMSDVVRLAENVVSELAENSAELSFFPEFELRDLDDLRLVALPAETQYKMLSRSAHEELPKVQFGVLKLCCREVLPELLEFVEKLGLGFLNRKIGDAACVRVAYNPIYSPAHLRERGQFTSVIELTFKLSKQ